MWNKFLESEPVNYEFILEEKCDSRILYNILTNGKPYMKETSYNSYSKYVNAHSKQPIDENGLISVFVHYSSKHFQKQSISRMYPTISRDGIKPEEHIERRCMTFSNNMEKHIKNTLCYKIYYDIDFQNSQPSILSQVFDFVSIKCETIKEYNIKREEILTKISEWYEIDRALSKQIFIQILYGGSIKSWKKENNIKTNKDQSFLLKFEKEVKKSIKILLEKDIMKRYIKYAKSVKEKDNPYSALSYFLMTIENRCLIELYTFFKKLGYTFGSFEYDGLKIYRIYGDMTPFPLEDLKNGEKYIFEKTGFKIVLVEKPIEPYIPFIENNNTYIIENESDAADIIIKNMKGKLIYEPKTSAIYYKKNNVWNKLNNASELNKFVNKYNFIKISNGNKSVYNRFNRNKNNISNSIIDDIDNFTDFYKDDFENLLIDSTKGKICFENGVYNFETGELIPWEDERTDNVYTAIISNHVYNPNVDKYYINYIENLLNEQFGKDICSEFLHIMARILAGCVEDKQWIVLFGNRNSGKGVTSTLLIEAFKSYIAIAISDYFSRKSGSGDPERDRGWLIPLRFARIILCNEIEPDCKLNGTMIKSISGGDVLIGRQIYKNSITFKHNSTLLLCCNDIPKSEPSDANENRKTIEMPIRYVSKEDIDKATEIEKKNMRLAIPDIKNILTRDKNYIDAFIYLIFKHYNLIKLPTPLIDEAGNGFIDSVNDINNDILKYFEIIQGDENAILTNNELKGVFNIVKGDLKLTESNQKLN